MTIEQEMSMLPNLKHVGLALVQFVYSLQPGRFEKKTEWIYRPNFVALAIRYRRVEKIELSLKEWPKDIEDEKVLPLDAGWPSGYVRGEITSPRQLACAARYIEVCHKIWRRKLRGE